jgi:hypothetical protein
VGRICLAEGGNGSREVVIGSGTTFGFHKRRGISEQTSQERLWYFACLLSAFISL